jgi:hypothetical protein
MCVFAGGITCIILNSQKRLVATCFHFSLSAKLV